MIRRALALVACGLLVVACGTSTPTATPEDVLPTITIPTPEPTPTPVPTLAPSPTPAGPFAGQAYSLDLPDGWVTFDLKDPAGKAALDAFVVANPNMAGAIDAFKSLSNVVMAVNSAAGNVVVSLSVPSLGLDLDTLGQSFTTQFQAVPGVKTVPVAENVTLPVGPAIHWQLAIEAKDPAGGTYEVGESIYLVANETTAVLVEFVGIGDAGVPQEQQIIQTLAFQP